MPMLPEEPVSQSEQFNAWITTYNYARFRETAQDLELRRDALTVLSYVRDHKVIGTQSTGNMPLKHIRAVTADFVTPPVLDQQIGTRLYKLRTEFEVWPLLFIHILLEVAELLETPQGARWRLTDAGERFLEGEPLLQTLYLFSTWWHRINWPVATRHDIELPRGFTNVTLAFLHSQPIGTWIDFRPFATTLGQRTGLYRPLPHTSDSHREDISLSLLFWDIRRMVIDRLIDFGATEARYRDEAIGSGSIEQIDAFRLTWFGRALLDGLSL